MITTICLKRSIRTIVASSGFRTASSSTHLTSCCPAQPLYLPDTTACSLNTPSSPFRTTQGDISPITWAILLLSLLLLPGCDKKESYKTSHPDKGAVAGVTEWSRRGNDVAIPAHYRVEASTQAATANDTTFIVPGLFQPGTVDVLAYNLPAGISVNDSIATMNTVADDTAGTLLVPDAGVLFSGTATADVIADDTVRITIPMHQRMRQVRFTLTVTDGDPERIATVEARLEGVAPAINLKTGNVTGDSTAIRIPFARTDNKLTAAVWIVGVIGEATHQIVTTLTFSDGYGITTTGDLTETFRNFNGDKLTPLDITGSLYAPVSAEPEGTIIDWTPVDGEDVDAKM